MKNARHEQILKLISEYEIETQEELAERLNESGFTVTQATVSRDIRQLLLHKVPGSNGHMKYATGSGEDGNLGRRYRRVLGDALVSAEASMNILVIKTVSGMAMAAAAALDSLDWTEILGCIAGDDTVMCVLRKPEDASAVLDRIRKLM